MDPVARHYQIGTVGKRILAALEAGGTDVENLRPEDLAPVDEFHIRGRQSTEELARLSELSEADRVLDVGCGIGGSCRYLVSSFGCRTVGVDLTPEYIESARMLTSRVGLDEKAEFHEASALGLPFEDESFDVVWTEHAQMNIADKAAFYGEIARVLRRGGRFLFHDIFAGAVGDVHFPVPWAESADISHLVRPYELRAQLDRLGLHVVHWDDKTDVSRSWFREALARLEAGAAPIVGIHLLMGENAPQKLENMARNLMEGRIAVIQAVLTR